MTRSLPLAVTSIVFLLPAEAGAQGLPSDPEANSPSGVVYELPFDRGRKDAAPRAKAAPRQKAKGTPRDNATGDPRAESPAEPRETSIRSENNFGSSSVVPGVDDASEEDSSFGGSGSGDGGPGDTGRGGVGSAHAQGGAATINTASTGEPDDGLVVPLLALIVVVGSTLGLLAGRAWRRRADA